MQTSKNAILTFLLSLNILSLAACNLPTPKDKNQSAENTLANTDSEAATFNVEAVPNRSTVLESTKEDTFALPTAKVFNFYACLKDVYYNKVISGHKFKIDETKKEITSDASGCLVWSEKIEFNFLADSQYVKLDRHIRGTGLHKGVRTVSFAINPWSHGETLAPVMDVKNEEAIPNLIKSPQAAALALKGLSADQKLRTRSLWLDEGRLFVTEQKTTSEGIDLSIEMRGTPSIQLTKMNGEISLRPLTAGSFKARMNLIHSYIESGKEIHRLLARTEIIDAKMENGSLALRSPLSLVAIPTRGQIVAGIELLPVNGPAGLTGFDGIYILGDYDQIKGTSFLKLATQVAQEKNFKIESYINSQLSSVLSQNSNNGFSQDNYQKPKVEIAPLEFKFLRVGDETTSSREIIYNVKACVKGGIDQKNLRSQTFKITKFRQNTSEPAQTISTRTINDACVSWDETIKFKYFGCQHYLTGFVQIENADLGMNEKLDIIVNPWDDSSSIARDMRKVDPSEKIITSCQDTDRPRTRIIADSFNYGTLSYNYEVDNLLNLTVVKKIQFKMEPRLLVYSSLTHGRSEPPKLRDGIYLLRVAVVKNRDYDSNNNTYITSTEKLINVTSGQINTELTLRTQDLKSLGNRNNMLIEVFPVDESKVSVRENNIVLKQNGASLESAIDKESELESPTYIGPVVLNLDETTRPLRVLDASAISSFFIEGKNTTNANFKGLISKIINQGIKDQEFQLKALSEKTSNTRYAQDNNLALLQLNKMDDSSDLAKALKIKSSSTRFSLSKSELQSIISKKSIAKETAQKLCAFWSRELLPSQFPEKGGSVTEAQRMGFASDCFHFAEKNPSQYFKLENRLLIKEVGPTQYVKGFNQGFSVGTSFAMSQAKSSNFTTSFSLSMKAGLSKKFLDLISLAGDMGLTAAWSETEASATGNSVSIGETTSMMVQQSLLKIRVNRYESCAIIRLNPALFVKSNSWFGPKDYLSMLNPTLTEQEAISAVTRGVMICEGQLRTQPIDIHESYYLIAQESNSSQMQDMGDERNRNFFLALRSVNDFNRFILAIKAEAKSPNTAEKDMKNETPHMMEKIFNLSNPAAPGMFLLY